MRRGKSRNKRKPYKKYESKYYKKYGYSIKDIVVLLEWSYGTVWAYYQTPAKRKEMLELVELEEQCN